MEVNNRFLDITCIPQRDEFFEPSGMIGIATDITDLKNSEIELKNNLSIAQETQKVKEQFLANMSHEIRTPIHGIMSLTNLLIKTNIDNDQMTYLNAIKKSADNLLVIINDILDLSKIEAQKMTFESTIFSATELVSTTFELFRAKGNEKGITITKNIDDCIPEYVKGDPTRLSQIINNLVNNAIKFTHKGGVEIGVKLVDTNENCSMIAFSIKDSGIGISQNKLSTIFDMFTQAGDDITRKYGGTGLGLSIAKKLVDLQGGIIKVDSVIDEGTTFTFSMPFDHPDPVELEAHHSQSEEPESRIESELRILIVEDNDINRLVINKIMKDWGVKLDNAVNGVDAIDKMKAKDYDIILLDIEMPEMNGYQCIREIRTALPEPKCHVSVMAMTAHANKKERDKCIGLGMDDYISKPFDPLDLKQKIVALSKKSLGGTCEAETVVEEKAPAAAPTQNSPILIT
ncbi:MAG: response regulator [Bacteroidetes bacterium]|nr:response regulator [Bacteroidota bacterium]